MSEELRAILNDDGVFEEYDDTYDLIIHCENEEEQEDVLNRLNWRWIPVSERLPEEGRPVLIYAWNVHHVIARYDSFRTENGTKKCWVTADAWNGNVEIKHEVIAWMPLPEPYKGESEEV